MEILNETIYDNTLRDWLIAAAVAAATYMGLRLVAFVAVARLARLAQSTAATWDDVVTHALGSTKGLLLVILSLSAGSRTLELPGSLTSAIGKLTFIAVWMQVGFWVSAGVRRWVSEARKDRSETDGTMVMTMSVVGIGLRVLVWSMVLLLALDNVGVDVTALVAGLGVGGIAVALAAQSILGDLFAAFAIVVDKPFVIGDFLVVGDMRGKVEEIGLKTTRVRSISGEQLVFSNTDLLGSRIRNFGRLFERRIVFSLGVTYQTPRQLLEAIPGMIRSAVERQGAAVRFERSHFQSYGDSALLFETVYHVLDADYDLYMDIQQAINLSIHEQFEASGIEFAYPTQTLYVMKANG